MSISKQSLILIPVILLLSACGGGSSGCTSSDGRPLDTTTSTSDNCGATGAPASIAISYPNVSTISHLTDAAGTSTGFYSYAGSVTVTDKNGNAVADGTIVQLDVIDTILASGTIDSISASTLTDAGATLSAGVIAAGDLEGANVNVGGAAIVIDSQSLVLVTNGADKQDQSRQVSSVTGNTITVTNAYNATYPNTTYIANSSQYVVGKTTVGMDILGIDPDNSSTKLVGYTKTVNGKASFRIEYPANDETLRIGCVDAVQGAIPAIDTRYSALNSRDVWVVAQVDGNPALTIVDDEACFFHILPESFSANTATPNSGDTITLTLADSQNVTLPFYTVVAATTGAATGTTCVTNTFGRCDVTVTGATTETVTYSTPNSGGTAVVFTIN